MNPILWRAISIYDDIFFTKVVAGLLASPHKSLGQYIRFVDIHVPIADAHLLLFTKHLTRLKKLKLYDARGITDLGIDYLGQYCPFLKTLYIADGSPELTQQAIHTLGRRFTKLCSLYLCGCSGISPVRGTFLALKACPLRKLLLQVGSLASIESSFISASLAADLIVLPHLTNLLLVEPPPHFNQMLFTVMAVKERLAADAAAAAAAGDGDGDGRTVPFFWPKLDDFGVTGCDGMDQSALMEFIKAHPRLTQLSLTYSQFTDPLLTCISTYLPRIQRVILISNTNFTAEAVRRMAGLCPELQGVALLNCRIRADMFPEAKDHCLGIDSDDNTDDGEHSFDSRGHPCRYLKGLDRPTIIKIQEKLDHDRQQQQRQQDQDQDQEQPQQQGQEQEQQQHHQEQQQ